MSGILLTLLILSILVIVHEFGHFIVAKLSGIKVIEFALFMGPKLFTIKGKETKYTLRLIPIGGFVSMEGEEETSEDKRAFSNKPWYTRALVILAGPLMNIIIAILITCILFSIIGFTTTEIAEVQADSIASQNGISPGDVIVEVNGMSVASYFELELSKQMGGELQNVEGTDKQKKIHTFVIKTKDGEYKELKSDYIGIVPKQYKKGESGFFTLLKHSYLFSYSMIRITLRSVWWLISGAVPVTEMAGPIGMTTIVNETVQQSENATAAILNLLYLTILISINLGVFNLLPIPALDGGRLLFIIVEAIRRKKIEPEKEAVVSLVGFVILIAFAIFVAINDIIKIIR